MAGPIPEDSMKYIHIVQFHLMSGGGVGSVITDVCEAMAKKSDGVYAISLFQRDGIDFGEELEGFRPSCPARVAPGDQGAGEG